MKFEKLTIEREWRMGPNKGKLIAKLEVEGRSAEMAVEIGEPASLEILKQCAGIVSIAAAEKAEEFRTEFLAAVSDKSPEGGAQ